jgi:hypothetical protein
MRRVHDKTNGEDNGGIQMGMPAKGQPQPSRRLRLALASWPAVSAFLAAVAAFAGFYAWLNAPTIDPADLVGLDSGTTMLSEPYLDVDAVNEAYAGRPPKAVSLAVAEFDTDASSDLAHGTQDYQRRHAPEPLCADEHVRPFVLDVFGPSGCESDSPFFTETERYERGLFWWAAFGDPAIGTPLPLTKPQFETAFQAMRAAETALVACTVSNEGKVAARIKVSPDSGMVPIDGQLESVLDPGATRAFLLKPAPGLAGPIGNLPRCAFDRSVADKELNKPYPRLQLAIAVFAAVSAAVTAGYAAYRGKDAE